MGSPNTLDLKQCLLGLLPNTIDKHTKTFLHEMLFSAQKMIAKNWMRPLPPKFVEWKVDINNTLPNKKCIHVNRGCPAKYSKIWE